MRNWDDTHTCDLPMAAYRVLAKQLTSVIKASVQAAVGGGKEVCGLLIDNGYFLELIPLRNRRKAGGFAFYPREVRKIEASVLAVNHRIIGTFHSHPMSVAKPGDGDIAGAPDDSLLLIVDAIKRSCALWRVRDGAAQRLRFKVLRGDQPYSGTRRRR